MLKHVGKMKHNGAKVCVVYRTLPGESDSALVVAPSSLSDVQHNTMMKELESLQGQEANELADLLNNRYFPDGSNMLHHLHLTGKLVKVPTDSVIMTPTSQSEIPLDQLNVMIAEQLNVPIDDLAMIQSDAPKKHETKVETVDIDNKPSANRDQSNVEITDHADRSNRSDVIVEDLIKPQKSLESARDYRSEADRLYKEAAKLRKIADELDPPKKKATSATLTQEATQ